MYNPFWNKYRYKLERAYELITFMIINHPIKNAAQKNHQEGLEQARRIMREFMDSNDSDKIIREFLEKYDE